MKLGSLKLFAAIFSFMLITSISFAQNSELKEKIQMMNNDLAKAIVAGDTETIMAMYTDDAVSLPSYEPMIEGKDAIMKKNKEDMEMGFKVNDMTMQTMNVWSSGSLAYEIGNYTIDISIPGMPDSWPDNGKYITIWEEQSDGSWKIKAETWNTDNNPWADMGMPEEEMEMEE
jgi:ketosteroid isomerase-like protein